MTTRLVQEGVHLEHGAPTGCRSSSASWTSPSRRRTGLPNWWTKPQKEQVTSRRARASIRRQLPKLRRSQDLGANPSTGRAKSSAPGSIPESTTTLSIVTRAQGISHRLQPGADSFNGRRGWVRGSLDTSRDGVYQDVRPGSGGCEGCWGRSDVAKWRHPVRRGSAWPLTCHNQQMFEGE